MDFFRWLIDLIAGIFRQPRLTHPEEPINMGATLANTDVQAVITQWLTDWNVPAVYWDYWRTAIDVQVYETYPDWMTAGWITQDTPAVTWEEGGKRHLAIKTQWLNPGVIAHEQAHNSYALLSPDMKLEWERLYQNTKTGEPLIKYLFSRKPYGRDNPIEGHAEIYRFLSHRMPAELKMYYPRLF